MIQDMSMIDEGWIWENSKDSQLTGFSPTGMLAKKEAKVKYESQVFNFYPWEKHQCRSNLSDLISVTMAIILDRTLQNFWTLT